MKNSKIIAIFVALSGLTACNHVQQTRTTTPVPVVTTSFNQIDVEFDYNSAILNPNAQAAIDEFILNHNLKDDDDLFIEVIGDKGSHSYNRAQIIGTYLERLNFRPRLIKVVHDDKVTSLQQVRLKVARYSAEVPGCPNWSDDPARSFTNELSSNFGCATATNLALMVDDPRDLLRGRDLAPADGAFLANTLGLYQRSEGLFLESRKLTTQDQE